MIAARDTAVIAAQHVVEGSQPRIGTAQAAKAGPAPWYDKLWRSVQQADADPESPESKAK